MVIDCNGNHRCRAHVRVYVLSGIARIARADLSGALIRAPSRLRYEEVHVKRSRTLLALMPAALVASLLASCSSNAGGQSGVAGIECAPEGAVSQSLEVGGDFGADDLTLTASTPLEATELQRAVLIEGDGEAVTENVSLEVQMSLFNGETGELMGSNPDTFLLDATKMYPWVLETLACSSVGDRVVAVAPAAEIFGAGGGVNLGLDDKQNLVYVFDVKGIDKGCESLMPRDEQYPQVDLGDGETEPIITIPECMEAPTELELEVLVEGDGPIVETDQDIMTRYVGVLWDGAERFDGDWSENGIKFSTTPGMLIEGFNRAMVGQKIGSVILVTIPPELGYNDGETRTFVLQLVEQVPAP